MTEPQSRPDQPLSVMLLGSRELSGELVAAFQRVGAVVTAVDCHAEAAAHRVADRGCVVQLSDPDELTALIEREQPDVVVTESVDPAAVAWDALADIGARGVAEVVPTASASRAGYDHEGLRRLAADELGLPTAPFWFAATVGELESVARHAGFPLAVRPVVGKPGAGESVLQRPDDCQAAWDHAAAAAAGVADTRVIAETIVDIDCQVTLLTVRGGADGGARVQFCEPIGHHGTDDLLEAWQPQQLPPAALDAARSIAARIVSALGGRGVYGVELLVKGDEVYFSGVSPRPYDNGLVTLRTQRLSQFELHARAVLGLPVDTIMITPGAAEVVPAGEPEPAGAAAPDGRIQRAGRSLRHALGVPESDVRILEHRASHPGRRLAVALATASDTTTARERARQVADALSTFW